MNEHCYDGMYIVQLYTARLGSAQQSTTKKWNDEKVHWCDMNEFLIAYYEFYAHSHYLWHLLCVCLLDFLAMIPFSLWLRPNSHCHNDNNFSKIVFTAWSGTLKTHNTHSQSFALSLTHTHTYQHSNIIAMTQHVYLYRIEKELAGAIQNTNNSLWSRVIREIKTCKRRVASAFRSI